MRAFNEWSAWEETWRAERSTPGQLDDMIRRTRAARRMLLFVRLVSTGIAAAALAILGLALQHAGNAFEAGLGLLVGAGVATVWLVDAANRRDALDGVDAPFAAYVATRRALCRRQLRFARLAQVVAALDLVFLIPWWIGGARIHGFGFGVTQVMSTWAPLTTLLTFLAWTFVLRSKVRSELDVLGREAGSRAGN